MLDRIRRYVPFLAGKGSGEDGSFLPEDYVRSRTERRANLISLSLFGVVMLCVVGAFFATNGRWMEVRERRRVIDEHYQQQAVRIEQLKTLEAQREAMIAKAEITTTLVELVPRSVLLAELSRRLPGEMTMLGFELESVQVQADKTDAVVKKQKASGVRSLADGKGGSKAGAEEEEAPPEPPRYRQTLTLEGVAIRNDDIAEYLSRLKDSELFETVELSYIKEAKVEGIDLRKFELVAKISEYTDAREMFLDSGPAQPLPEPRQISSFPSAFRSLFGSGGEGE